MSPQKFRKKEIYKKGFQKIAVAALFFGILLLSSYQNPLNKEEYNDFFLPETQLLLNQQFSPIMNDSTGFGKIKHLVSAFYYEVNYKPVWTFETEINNRAQILMQLLNHAEYYGFRKDLYAVSGLKISMEQLKESQDYKKIIENRFEYEYLMTEMSLRFLINLKWGKVHFDTLQLSAAESHYLIEKLHLAIQGDFKRMVLSVQPQFIEYQRLQAANKKFIQNTGLDQSTNGLTFPINNEDSAKKSITIVLYHQGLLDSANIKNDTIYRNALKKYQQIHSIKPNGLLTKKTINQLNKSTYELFDRVANNLDFYRKKPGMQNTCVFVNIPSFSLKLINNNSIVKNYNVIVGKKTSPTPMLESDISTIVTNPYWTVPKKIAMNELIPKIQRDSTYLSRNGFKLIDHDFNEVDVDQIDFNNVTYRNFNYKFRQESFDGNALGKIKFLFDNPYSVYLHDTPSKAQFNHQYRAYSHGCVRVQNPMHFADDLLQLTQDEDPHHKTRLLSNSREFINLRNPVKIYITYNLCGVDENENLVFYQDIYNYKQGQLN
ncbi:MAG: L,D-transpeptidase family protein [Bacteroidetes bacterium]|jgi:murein L,D-transpeptidase YcbB/YkuD|nr:L,D-transpeptidase family protein [Bacteroidota bacterium]